MTDCRVCQLHFIPIIIGKIKRAVGVAVNYNLNFVGVVLPKHKNGQHNKQ